MKRFRFRLSRLSRVRAIQEELARAEWRAAEDLALRAEARVHEMQDLVAATNAALRELLASGEVPQLEVLAHQDLQDRVRAGLQQARRQAGELRVAAERAREPWTALRVELEGLQRLEDRARENHHAELTRAENAELDQIAQDRAVRATRTHS